MKLTLAHTCMHTDQQKQRHTWFCTVGFDLRNAFWYDKMGCSIGCSSIGRSSIGCSLRKYVLFKIEVYLITLSSYKIPTDHSDSIKFLLLMGCHNYYFQAVGLWKTLTENQTIRWVHASNSCWLNKVKCVCSV